MTTPQEQPEYLQYMEDVEHIEYPHVPGGYPHGWKYHTFFIDTSIFLPWLLQRFIAGGGILVLLDKPFAYLEELAELPVDIIFNCTGLGARELCRDDKVMPIKGQIALTQPQPAMHWSISADGFYIYPRKHSTVLGGTVEWGIDGTTVEPATIERIIHGNQRILPQIHRDSITKTYAGLRPYRAGSIRLESESIHNRRLIHNYGHGGAGLTLCWGSAHLALALAE